MLQKLSFALNIVLIGAVIWLGGRHPADLPKPEALPSNSDSVLSARVDALLAENADLKSKIQAQADSPAFSDTRVQTAPSRRYDSAPAAPKEKVEIAGRSFRDWFLERKIADIEKYAVITDQEKSVLKQKLGELSENRRERMRRGEEVGDPAADEQGAFADILGQERADSIAASRAAKEAQAERENFEQTLFTFSRKLALTPDQESRAAAALHDVDIATKSFEDTISAKMKTITAQHGTASPEAMRAAFEELQKMRTDSIDARRKLIEEKFKPILSEEQYNRLLEEGAKTEGTYGVGSF